MAFALSLQSVQDLPDGHGKIFLTTTLFTVLFTVSASFLLPGRQSVQWSDTWMTCTHPPPSMCTDSRCLFPGLCHFAIELPTWKRIASNSLTDAKKSDGQS
jgi:hypothetical protein